MTTFQFPKSFRWIALLALLPLTGCEDPQREVKLQWREDEVNKKEAAVIQREMALAKEKQVMEGNRLDLLAKEKSVASLQKQLEEEVEKTKRVRREVEIRQLRGPIPQISADRVIVIDAASDEIMFEKNPDKRGAIASTTKLLTALLVVEAGELDKIVTVEESDTQCSPVRIGLKAGEQYTRRQLLTAMLVKSSNDIAQALARDNAGSVEAFAAKMNEKCLALGLQDSHYVNPHGLPARNGDEPFSTARDLSAIAKACDVQPAIREIVKLQSYSFKWPNGRVTELSNTNRVLRSAGYCDGMKTGYTDAAGYCLVASGERNGKRRIVVVLNDTEGGVWRDAQALLDWALKA
ncbi:D-alanyl-D-alanine carboxypeptidase (penicillin-binding protein 5/6) [Prosthecobacter fusiformis]|uniref:D-alanyl-D-alanine carboxypeptidase (Penicillin-binding protein 5/6) n=1 Tax=Prosthecobacter fusiformis TaxID=48464 RepID=A0A4R7SU12_9BACT|nr:D-alanyl-D-alanine carboxypeptidase family protein [Prosthecobacter fusiformis]TDU81768.1 D-alanyl-D-alanine carboxypeptidase (penicillin-binding protein 5/6) [Prosthecobacter fusiformis]